MQIKPISEIESIELVPIKDFTLIQKIENIFNHKIKFIEIDDNNTIATTYLDSQIIKINTKMIDILKKEYNIKIHDNLNIIFNSVLLHEIGHIIKNKIERITAKYYFNKQYFIREELAANFFGIRYAIDNEYNYDKQIMYAPLLHNNCITLNKIDLIEKALLKQKNNLTSQKTCVNV